MSHEFVLAFQAASLWTTVDVIHMSVKVVMLSKVGICILGKIVIRT